MSSARKWQSTALKLLPQEKCCIIVPEDLKCNGQHNLHQNKIVALAFVSKDKMVDYWYDASLDSDDKSWDKLSGDVPDNNSNSVNNSSEILDRDTFQTIIKESVDCQDQGGMDDEYMNISNLSSLLAVLKTTMKKKQLSREMSQYVCILETARKEMATYLVLSWRGYLVTTFSANYALRNDSKQKGNSAKYWRTQHSLLVLTMQHLHVLWQ